MRLQTDCKFTFLFLLLWAGLNALGADVRWYGVAKGKRFIQSDAGNPVPQAAIPFEFRAVAIPTGNNLGEATVRPPGSGVAKPLTNFLNIWERREVYNAQANLNFANPNGVYVMILATALDGKKTNNLTVSGDFYPNIPRISNFPAAQQIDAASDFVLRWDAMGLDSGDFLQLRVYEGTALVFETGYPGGTGVIAGTATSFAIPRNNLKEGRIYRAELVAWNKNGENLSSYPGVQGYAAYTAQTEFPMRTGWPVTDVHWVGAAKVQRYDQTSPGPPIARIGLDQFEFSAFAEATALPNVTTCSIKSPGGIIKNLTGVGTAWGWKERYATQAGMDAALATGVYELTLQTLHNGIQKVNLNFGSMNYPVPPQISNWLEANTIDFAKPFTLRWAALPGGSTNDFLRARIIRNGQEIFATGGHPMAPGALNGLATSVTIPAGLLAAGDSCECVISYIKPVFIDSFSYPGALAFAGYGRETVTTLRTRSVGLPAPTLGTPRILNGFFEFNTQTEPGRLCVVQASSNFVWGDIGLTNSAPNGGLNIRVPISNVPGGSFFRLLVH